MARPLAGLLRVLGLVNCLDGSQLCSISRVLLLYVLNVRLSSGHTRLVSALTQCLNAESTLKQYCFHAVCLLGSGFELKISLWIPLIIICQGFIMFYFIYLFFPFSYPVETTNIAKKALKRKNQLAI